MEHSSLLKLSALSVKIHGLILEKKIKDDTAEYKITHSFKRTGCIFFIILNIKLISNICCHW